jgi:hypothetical protein
LPSIRNVNYRLRGNHYNMFLNGDCLNLLSYTISGFCIKRNICWCHIRISCCHHVGKIDMYTYSDCIASNSMMVITNQIKIIH